MAKRFTDIDKWKDAWFLDLEPAMKCLWSYICDTCDCAGVWKVNFKQASFNVGALLDKQSALKAFEKRVRVISEDKWFIEKFIKFQYPKGLSTSCNAHVGVIKSLNYHGLETYPYLTLVQPITNSTPTVQDKDKDKDKDKDSSLSSFLNTEEDEKNLPAIQSQDFRNPKDSQLSPDNVIQLFNNECAGKGKISHCRGFSKKTNEDFFTTTSYAEFRKLDTWQEVFLKTGDSPFLTGQQPGSNFVATLNWLVIHDNALKVLNGQYGKGDNQNALKANLEHRKPKQLTAREIQLLQEAGQI